MRTPTVISMNLNNELAQLKEKQRNKQQQQELQQKQQQEQQQEKQNEASAQQELVTRTTIDFDKIPLSRKSVSEIIRGNQELLPVDHLRLKKPRYNLIDPILSSALYDSKQIVDDNIIKTLILPKSKEDLHSYRIIQYKKQLTAIVDNFSTKAKLLGIDLDGTCQRFKNNKLSTLDKPNSQFLTLETFQISIAQLHEISQLLDDESIPKEVRKGIILTLKKELNTCPAADEHHIYSSYIKLKAYNNFEYYAKSIWETILQQIILTCLHELPSQEEKLPNTNDFHYVEYIKKWFVNKINPKANLFLDDYSGIINITLVNKILDLMQNKYGPLLSAKNLVQTMVLELEWQSRASQAIKRRDTQLALQLVEELKCRGLSTCTLNDIFILDEHGNIKEVAWYANYRLYKMIYKRLITMRYLKSTNSEYDYEILLNGNPYFFIQVLEERNLNIDEMVEIGEAAFCFTGYEGIRKYANDIALKNYLEILTERFLSVTLTKDNAKHLVDPVTKQHTSFPLLMTFYPTLLNLIKLMSEANFFAFVVNNKLEYLLNTLQLGDVSKEVKFAIVQKLLPDERDTSNTSLISQAMQCLNQRLFELVPNLSKVITSFNPTPHQLYFLNILFPKAENVRNVLDIIYSAIISKDFLYKLSQENIKLVLKYWLTESGEFTDPKEWKVSLSKIFFSLDDKSLKSLLIFITKQVSGNDYTCLFLHLINIKRVQSFNYFDFLTEKHFLNFIKCVSPKQISLCIGNNVSTIVDFLCSPPAAEQNQAHYDALCELVVSVDLTTKEFGIIKTLEDFINLLSKLEDNKDEFREETFQRYKITLLSSQRWGKLVKDCADLIKLSPYILKCNGVPEIYQPFHEYIRELLSNLTKSSSSNKTDIYNFIRSILADNSNKLAHFKDCILDEMRKLDIAKLFGLSSLTVNISLTLLNFLMVDENQRNLFIKIINRPIFLKYQKYISCLLSHPRLNSKYLILLFDYFSQIAGFENKNAIRNSEELNELLKLLEQDIRDDNWQDIEISIRKIILRASNRRFQEKDLNLLYKEFTTTGPNVDVPLSTEIADLIFSRYKKIYAKGLELNHYANNDHYETYLLNRLGKILKSDFSLAYSRRLPLNLAEEDKIEILAILREFYRLFYSIYPYNVQMLDILVGIDDPHGKYGIQKKPGQGKSLVIAIRVAYRALVLGRQTHIATSSADLAVRDAVLYAEFYKKLGILCTSIADGEDLFKYRTKEGALYDVIFTQIHFLQFRDLFIRLGYSPDTLTYYDDICIDEADDTLIDRMSELAQAAENDQTVEGEIMAEVEDEDENNEYEASEDSYQFKISESQRYQFLWECFDSESKPTYKEVEQIWNLSPRIPFTPILFQRLNNSYQTAKKLKENEDYYISNREVILVDKKYSGNLLANTSWMGGVYQFVCAKHGLPIKPPQILRAISSKYNYLQKYGSISLYSGTMGVREEAEYFKSLLNVTTYHSPSYHQSNQQFLPNIIAEDIDEQFDEILAIIIKMQNENRPILIICETIDKSTELYKKLLEHLQEDKLQLYNGVQEKDPLMIVKDARQNGMVTIATNTASRGTDIIAENIAKGLHVICAYLPINLRIMMQIIFRAFRNDYPGSFQFIVTLDEFIGKVDAAILEKGDVESIFNAWKDFLAKSTKETLTDLEKNVRISNLLFPIQECLLNVLFLFEKTISKSSTHKSGTLAKAHYIVSNVLTEASTLITQCQQEKLNYEMTEMKLMKAMVTFWPTFLSQLSILVPVTEKNKFQKFSQSTFFNLQLNNAFIQMGNLLRHLGSVNVLLKIPGDVWLVLLMERFMKSTHIFNLGDTWKNDFSNHCKFFKRVIALPECEQLNVLKEYLTPYRQLST